MDGCRGSVVPLHSNAWNCGYSGCRGGPRRRARRGTFASASAVERPSVRSGPRRRSREVGAVKVLVAYASKYGATQGIAERIGRGAATTRPRGRRRAVHGRRGRDRVRRRTSSGPPRTCSGGARTPGSSSAATRRCSPRTPRGCSAAARWVRKMVDAKGHDVLEGAVPKEFAEFDRRSALVARRSSSGPSSSRSSAGSTGWPSGPPPRRCRRRLPRLGRDRGVGGRDRRRTRGAAART
jgi:hypothetical protein